MKNSNSLISNSLTFPCEGEAPTREGYGQGLVLAGEADPRVVVLCADLTESTRSILFKDKFPDRFVEIGVAEQLLATVASGLANYGKVPFISSYAAFSPGRNWEQIRTTIALNNQPVKIAGAHAGISVGPDGATHQALEDLALMRVLPNMIVIYPCDALEAKKATLAAAQNGKPTYLRFNREKTPLFTTEKTPFEIGKAEVFREGRDVTIIAGGPLVYQALLAAQRLDAGSTVDHSSLKESALFIKKDQGANLNVQNGKVSPARIISCEVINCHTIKPLDGETILKSVKKTGCVVTVEEHQIAGGLGGAVSEFLSEVYPVKIKRVGMKDRFGESGEPEELLHKFGLDAEGIAKAVLEVIQN